MFEVYPFPRSCLVYQERGGGKRRARQRRASKRVRKTAERIALPINLNMRTVDDHPLGYPRMAAFINSDPSFLMCRRFGFLHTRVLLYRQDELAQLEQQLVELDVDDADNNPKVLISRELDEQQDSTRKDLIFGIDEKLKQYGWSGLPFQPQGLL